MSQAAEKEYSIAKEKGKMCGDIAECTVVVDGGWSHRSYGHNYNSKSGVACIIGQNTKNILFLGIRNKYCSICANAKSKSIAVPHHKCYCNWSGSSTAMEADILTEGFRNSEAMYKLRHVYK